MPNDKGGLLVPRVASRQLRHEVDSEEPAASPAAHLYNEWNECNGLEE